MIDSVGHHDETYCRLFALQPDRRSCGGVDAYLDWFRTQDYWLEGAMVAGAIASYEADSENHDYVVYLMVELMIDPPAGAIVGALGGLGLLGQRRRLFQPLRTQLLLMILGLRARALSLIATHKKF